MRQSTSGMIKVCKVPFLVVVVLVFLECFLKFCLILGVNQRMLVLECLGESVGKCHKNYCCDDVKCVHNFYKVVLFDSTKLVSAPFGAKHLLLFVPIAVLGKNYSNYLKRQMPQLDEHENEQLGQQHPEKHGQRIDRCISDGCMVAALVLVCRIRECRRIGS